MGYLNAKYAQRTSQKISAGNDVPYAPRQMPEIERLGDHVHAGPKKAFGVCSIFGIAGHEEDLQIRSQFPCLIRKLATVHARQPDVGQQEIDGLVRCRIRKPAAPSAASRVR